MVEYNDSLLGERDDRDELYLSETTCSIYFKGFKAISIPDDQEEAYIAQDVLSSVYEGWEERCECLRGVHILLKRYPHVGDLWALLVIAYRIMCWKNRFKKLLLKGRVRFPNNQTLQLLSYLEGIDPLPKVLPFPSETLVDSYICYLIGLFQSLSEGDLQTALDIFGEMVTNAQKHEQLDHWAVTQGTLALSIFTEENESD